MAPKYHRNRKIMISFIFINKKNTHFFGLLLVALQNDEFTCSEVVSAYYSLALKANENINAIVLFIKVINSHDQFLSILIFTLFSF